MDDTVNDVIVVDDDGEGNLRAGDRMLRGREVVIESAGRDVLAYGLREPGDTAVLAFKWQSGGRPVRLPAGVVVDLMEPVTLKPARGSRGEVSEEVVAVDDHRVVRPEPGQCLSGELLQRNALSAGDVGVLVSRCRQHLDELAVLLLDEPTGLAASDHHRGSPHSSRGRISEA
jgi:hypothetical protein